METLIKIDELRPIVSKLNNGKITYGKAIELITDFCNERQEKNECKKCNMLAKHKINLSKENGILRQRLIDAGLEKPAIRKDYK